MVGITSVQLGNTVVQGINVKAIKVPGTIKQVIGKKLNLIREPERTTQDLRITINADIVGGDRDEDRVNIDALDEGNVFTYTDGLHDGQFIIVTGTLRFTDLGARPTYHNFTVQLIQFQQVD